MHGQMCFLLLKYVCITLKSSVSMCSITVTDDKGQPYQSLLVGYLFQMLKTTIGKTYL